MSFRGDRRGQAIQIGAVLLLGALVLAFSMYQAFVVPEQNQAVEFTHSQDVQGQLQDLRNALVSTRDGASGQSVSVELGTQYPSRIVALNPPDPSGSIATVGTRSRSINATVAHARASGETGDFWDGRNRSYNTGAIAYRPGYNEYTNAPVTWYEHSVLYNRFSDANLTLTGQRLVDSDTITLVTMNGSFSTSRTGTVSLDVRPISAAATTVTVTNETASTNVTLTLPTRLSAEDWRTLLDGEFTPSGHVVSVSTTPVAGADFDLLTVVLEQGVTYELQLSRAGIGTGVVNPGPAYLTVVEGNGSTVPEDGTVELTVEVRDAFNNPVSDTTVTTGTSRSDSSVTPASEPSNADGEVTLIYDAPGDVSGVTQANDTVTASLSGTAIDGFANATVDLTVRVDNTDGSGLSTGTYDVAWEFSTIESETGVRGCFDSNDTCVYDLGLDPSGKFDATMNTTAPTTGAFVDFTRTSSILSLNPSEDTTDAAGKAVTTVTAGSAGTTELTGSTTEDSDTVSIRVVDSGSAGPPAPQNVAATALSGGAVDVSFDDVDSGTTSYSVRRSTTSGGSYNEVGTVTDDDSASYTFTDTGTTDGTTYYYVVVPVAVGTEGTPSTEVSATADATAPTLDSASRVDDTTLDLTLSDSATGLDVSSITAGDFDLDVGSISSIDTSTIADGDTSRTVTVNLGSPVNSDTVTVSLQSDGIDDLAGNTQTSGSATVSGMDGVAPSITGVTKPADGTYTTGDTLSFDVSYDEAVQVSGTPTITLDIDGDGNNEAAEYVSGGGTQTLTFEYTVQSGDNDGDGIAFASTTISGGTLTDTSGNSADRDFSGASYDLSNVFVDTAAPSGLSIDTPTSEETKQTSETLDVGYSYGDANPDSTTVTFTDGNSNTATYVIDDTGYAGDNNTKTVTVDLSSPDSTTGNGFVDSNTYEITVQSTDAFGQSSSTSRTDLLTIDNPSANDLVQVVSGATSKSGVKDSNVTFTLENTGEQDVTIRNLTVVSTANSDADQVGNGVKDKGSYVDKGPEFTSNRTGILLDKLFSFGTVQNTADSTIPAGARTKFTLGEFRKSQSENEVDPGATVSIRIGFVDGSEKSIKLSFP